ncbi:sensor histidine kinase [Streptomyces niveiscabiei]|uniref:Sensor histidine kinase n=1 Tax=Streptomyces niveiscabiei TaxID=164115 RepID=A0ABW9HJ94_9ACTN
MAVREVTVEALPAGPELATILTERSEELLARYGERLDLLGLGGADPPVREFCVAQARAVLADVLLALRSEGSLLGVRAQAPREAAGPSPLSWNPYDAQRAVLTLFDVVMTTMARCVAARGGDVRMVADIAISLHHSIMSRFEQALEAKVRALLHETAAVYEEDRRGVSRDLHDRVGYAVTVAKQNLELADLYRERVDGPGEEKLRLAHEALREALEEVRELASGLRAFGCTDGLERALRRCAESLRPAGARVEIQVTGHEGWVPPDALDDLFLALREALRNCCAHAAARTVAVRVDIAPRQVWAFVEDDGVGFSAGRAPDGVGLVCMRERIARHGGEVTVTGFPGHGVTVEFQLPVSRK